MEGAFCLPFVHGFVHGSSRGSVVRFRLIMDRTGLLAKPGQGVQHGSWFGRSRWDLFHLRVGLPPVVGPWGPVYWLD